MVLMRRLLKAFALASALAVGSLSLAGCDVVDSLSLEERVYICAAHRPWPGGHIYFVAKVDPNSLKCWYRFDGCWTYQLDYEFEDWFRRFFQSIPCPPDPV